MARRKIVLGGVTYAIGKAKEKCYSILHENYLHEILLGEDFEIIRDLYSYHPELPDLAEQIDAIKIGITTHASGNRHRAFHVMLLDGDGFSERPSYLACFNPGPRSLFSFVTKAMRHEVDHHIKSCRLLAGSDEKGHVHHAAKSFSEIRNEWLEKVGGIDVVKIEKDDAIHTHKMCDPIQQISWQDYHRRNATLVFMTPEQHSMHHYNRPDGFNR